MMFSLHLSSLLGITLLCFYVAVSVSGFQGMATHTDSAIRARQLTRERFMNRAEKLTMGSLFGREDCSCVPRPRLN